eukprot:scaffold34572_cov54-Attheya_sp.AAC.5
MDMGNPGVFRISTVRESGFGGLGKVKLFSLKVIKSMKEEFVGIHWMFKRRKVEGKERYSSHSSWWYRMSRCCSWVGGDKWCFGTGIKIGNRGSNGSGDTSVVFGVVERNVDRGRTLRIGGVGGEEGRDVKYQFEEEDDECDRICEGPSNQGYRYGCDNVLAKKGLEEWSR